MRKTRGRSGNWAWKPPYSPDQAINWPSHKGQKKTAERREIERLKRQIHNLKKGDRRARKEHPFFDSPRWQRLRFEILKRDGGMCQLCGVKAGPGVIIQVDHIKPRSLYPLLEWDPKNLQALCKPCNLGKSNRDTTDFRK